MVSVLSPAPAAPAPGGPSVFGSGLACDVSPGTGGTAGNEPAISQGGAPLVGREPPALGRGARGNAAPDPAEPTAEAGPPITRGPSDWALPVSGGPDSAAVASVAEAPGAVASLVGAPLAGASVVGWLAEENGSSSALGRRAPAAPGPVAGLGAGGNGGCLVLRKRLEPAPGWLGGKGLGGRSGGVVSRRGRGTAGSLAKASVDGLATTLSGMLAAAPVGGLSDGLASESAGGLAAGPARALAGENPEPAPGWLGLSAADAGSGWAAR
jgi:hypothetical protein